MLAYRRFALQWTHLLGIGARQIPKDVHKIMADAA